MRGEPRFVPYFRAATPELELGALNVGSRPAKRNPKGGVESLRAIPWIFAWSQTRLNLPAWLGIAEALAPGENAGAVDDAMLKDMYQNWPWFTTNIDLVETLLAKSDGTIAAYYDTVLVDRADTDSVELGEQLRGALAQTENAVRAPPRPTAIVRSNCDRLVRSLRRRSVRSAVAARAAGRAHL